MLAEPQACVSEGVSGGQVETVFFYLKKKLVGGYRVGDFYWRYAGFYFSIV